MKHLNILFLLLLFSNFAFSQVGGLLNNGANIVITAGAIEKGRIYIDGDANGNFTNANNGLIDLDGIMYVEGNWTNNAANNVFINIEPVPDGIVKFVGTTTQDVSGNTTTFENLVINNTAAATAVNLSVNTIVKGTLTLTDGALILNSNTLTVENSATTAITGGSASSYIVSETNAATNNSILQWNIGSTTGDHIFPFGTAVGGNYIPVTFNNTGNTSGNVSISTRPTAADDNLPWATGVTSMTGVGTNLTTATDRWWNISCGTNPVVGGANVTFSYLGTENATTTDPTATRGVQHWNGSFWNDGKGGTFATVASSSDAGVTGGIGTVSVTGLTEFSPYVVVKAAAPLPIDLLYFNAVCKNDVAEISWQTASEINNDYFTVEKSLDGIYFEEIVQINGAGNSNNVLSYSFIDNEPFDKTSYYRLKQTDFDGNFSYYDIVAVNCYNSDDNLFIYTSHESENILISLNGYEGETFDIYFIDQLGRTLIQKHITISGPDEKILISKSNLAIGIYNVILKSVNNVVCKRIVIIK